MEKLAIYGGIPVRKTPFSSWPFFDQDEISAALVPLASGKVNYWTGQEGRKFEQEFASSAGCKYAIALANGTVALELALYVLGIGPGDEVIVTCRTFIASASAVVMRGAIPVMADVDPVSQNVTAETLKAALTPRTKAIIAVHLAGWPCDMDSILGLAREHGLKVIEDCAQSHGAKYRGRPIGSMGDVAAFSFCHDKIMTTGGEGGMLTTNDQGVWELGWAFKDHGKSWDTLNNHKPTPGFRWLHESFGTNWRLTEMQSAIGRIQLKKLPDWIRIRQRYAAILTEGLSRSPALRLTCPPDDISHAFYKYYAFVRSERLKDGWERDRIISAVNAEGVPCFSGSCSEIYLEKAFINAKLGPPKRLPVAKVLGETSLMFLVHPTLSEQDIRDTCNAVEKVLEIASR
jgi:dTDP-4-amino-4,6-dideoxygalactose transaminase